MVNNWEEVTVEEIKAPSSNALTTGPFGSSISARFFQTHGVPVIRGSNLSEDVEIRLITENTVFLSQEKAKEFARSIARRGDLIFTCWGTVGQVGLIDKTAPFPEYVISNKQMKLTPDPSKTDSLFLYYLFSGPEMSGRIRNQAIGSSVPGFNLGQLRSLKLLLPPLKEQQAIAYILGSLDDKIELNRQMNETLEDIARTLFKSWFVDFDPVRAKMEGREPYGMDAETAVLFPDGFEDSVLGEIPKGWRVATFASEIGILSGGTPKTTVAEYWEGSVPWVSIVDTVPGPYIVSTEKTITELGVENSAAKILPSETIIITARGTVGNCALLSRPMAMNQSCYGLRGKEHIGQLFLLHQVRNQIRDLKASAHGSVFDTITRSTFDNILVVFPTTEVLSKYELVTRPLFDQILNNQQQNQTLTALRDTLLPKLLSGEIRVKDAEKAVEASV